MYGKGRGKVVLDIVPGVTQIKHSVHNHTPYQLSQGENSYLHPANPTMQSFIQQLVQLHKFNIDIMV